MRILIFTVVMGVLGLILSSLTEDKSKIQYGVGLIQNPYTAYNGASYPPVMEPKQQDRVITEDPGPTR